MIILRPQWTASPENTYRVIVDLLQEQDGRYSVWVANLPGVASMGNSWDEALANIKEAFIAVAQSYWDDGMAIPWCEPNEPEVGVKRRWLTVTVPAAT